MNRVFIIFTFGLLMLFVTITFLKTRSSEVTSQNHDVDKKLVEKEKIQLFWKIYRQATEHRIAGRLKRAAEDYRQALDLNDRHEDALYYFGNVSLQLGEFKAAEKSWKRLVQINPNSARAHFQLGDFYLNFEQKGLFDIEKAEAEYRRALEINKEETGPLLRLGQVALIRRNMLEAERYFNAVIGSNDRSVEACFLKGYIAWKTEDYRKASTLLSRAAKYSRPVKPILGVLGEGDTKPGHSLGLSELSKVPPLLRAHMADLSEVGEVAILQQTDMRYQKLDAFLQRLN